MPNPDMTLMRHLADRAKLAGGGGSSNDGGMEARVAALEAGMQDVRASLGRLESLARDTVDRLRGLDDRVRKLEIETAEIKGRVSQLPTVWPLLTGGFTMVFAAISFTFLIIRFSAGH